MVNFVLEWVTRSASVRNLGVFMDRGNTSESQVNALCKKCTFHLRRIGSIRRFLPRDVLQGIGTALVLSNLDYCNALLSGITAHQLQRLQRIQNWAARMISEIKLKDHITPILQDLHWLPVNLRISYKLMLYMYKSINGHSPSYLTQMIEMKERPVRLSQFDDQLQLMVLRTRRLSTGTAFSVNGPKLWNALPFNFHR